MSIRPGVEGARQGMQSCLEISIACIRFEIPFVCPFFKRNKFELSPKGLIKFTLQCLVGYHETTLCDNHVAPYIMHRQEVLCRASSKITFQKEKESDYFHFLTLLTDINILM